MFVTAAQAETGERGEKLLVQGDAAGPGLGKAREVHRDGGAGHAVRGGGGEKYREARAKDSWSKALDCLGRHLGRAG